ncbi:MAG: glycoside hydrolase, family 3 domain protein [Frankiales bacterium]|nr:glycoside hydrolase, family 3 domain protein [Frankiales bacterium]
MTISLHGAGLVAASTLTAALLAVAVAVPTAHDRGGCVTGNACPDQGASAQRTPAQGTPTDAARGSTGTASFTSEANAASAPPATPTATPSPGATEPVPPPPPPTDAEKAAAVLATMTRSQRIGQLFMVGNDANAVSSSTLTAVTKYHVGNVMLRGRSSAGVAATAKVSAGIRARVGAASTGSVGLFLATDQEGGSVRVLRGTGFDVIPSALTQGGWSTTTLRTSAARWGAQLHKAGINLDLAPVLDVVPSAASARLNPPIGVFNREFGYTPARVSSHGIAVMRGLADAHVDSSIKHFPGLGRVTANPDNSSSVTDRITTRYDAYLAPFQDAIEAGATFLMMSTAYYSRIDAKHPAAFSKTVVTGMVRGDLGFGGVVISDDLGNAKQVAQWTPGSRAVQFLAAGGDMVLTVNTSLMPSMIAAVRARAAADPAFAAQVDAAALRVLTAKAALGLLPAAP